MSSRRNPLNDVFGPDVPMAERLQAYLFWVRSGLYKIRNRSGKLVTYVPNRMQDRIWELMYQQALAQRPIRIIGLKPRKRGFSTGTQLTFDYLTQFTPYWRSRTIAHTDDSTADIHDISRVALKPDHLESGPKPETTGNPIRFAHDAEISTRTAGGVFVSSGATINALHLSELAKWQGGTRAVRGQLASVLGSVPEDPFSIIVIESTANMLDESGEFKGRWLQARRGEGAYEALFSPWHDDEEYRKRCPAKGLGELDEYEIFLRGELHLADEQITWYRSKLWSDFNGDRFYMKQEYPSTEEEAFQSPSGLIFPMLTGTKNDREIVLAQLLEGGYEFFRGIDWGGSEPFACVWVAHNRKSGPGFSVDRGRCPNTWRELTGYAWGKVGKPVDENDHTVDALRYVISHYNLSGHVHVYGELYEPEPALHGRSVLDQAQTILAMGGEHFAGTVADRSQPATITLVNQQGLACCGNSVPEHIGARGEKYDGINRMTALMIASLPLAQQPKPETWQQRLRRRRQDDDVAIGFDSSETRVAWRQYEQDEQQSSVGDIFTGIYD